jgi:hypothetical protein
MFVQVIQGRTSDAEGLRAATDRWTEELAPHAVGWLGSTGGVTDDGRAIVVVRFESEDAARRNSDRPEQGEWWAETEKYYDGGVSFTESSDTALFLGGGDDSAGFVQVMKVSGVDRAQVERLDHLFEDVSKSVRPDLLGGIRAWTGADSYVEFAYFTSEEEARAGESTPPPAEMAEAMSEFQAMNANTEFIDLSDPWIN